MGDRSSKHDDDLEGQYSPLQSRSLSEAWAESAWNAKKTGRRSAQSQYVQPRMQIKRDFEEAKRVARMPLRCSKAFHLHVYNIAI